MTTALMERAPAVIAPVAGEEPTLDALLVHAWDALASAHPTECPVCDETLQPVFAAHARPVGGRCTSCGTEIR